MNKRISIVIPAFEESERIGDSILQILTYISANSLDAELIVVDDGSKDDTKIVAESFCGQFPEIDSRVIKYQKNCGKGFAVKTGLLAATGAIALFSDADLSTPISELPKLIDPIKDDICDVAFGSRALDRSLIGTHQPWRREQGGKVFNLVVRTLTGLPFWDTQCGFKAFSMTKFRPLLELMTVDRFGFDVEFLYAANHNGLRLKEIPVRWNHCDGTKISFLGDSRKMFNEVRLIRQNAARGVYDRGDK